MEEFKRAAARAALDYMEDGMRVGIGTGSTAEAFIDLLAERVDAGLGIVGVPTSERTAHRCTELGIPLASLDEVPELDVTVDGADEIGPSLALIKGAGGALLREKIVAYASERMIVIADHSKRVDRLGAFALPIEVSRFGMQSTMRSILRAAAAFGCQGDLVPRQDREGLVRTDGGNYIVDAAFGTIPEPAGLASALSNVPGVLEHGLFIGLASIALIAGPDGVDTIERSHG